MLGGKLRKIERTRLSLVQTRTRDNSQDDFSLGYRRRGRHSDRSRYRSVRGRRSLSRREILDMNHGRSKERMRKREVFFVHSLKTGRLQGRVAATRTRKDKHYSHRARALTGGNVMTPHTATHFHDRIQPYSSATHRYNNPHLPDPATTLTGQPNALICHYILKHLATSSPPPRGYPCPFHTLLLSTFPLYVQFPLLIFPLFSN